MKRVVMFSGGAGSWGAARRIADQHGTADLTLLFTDTLVEDPDLYRFIYQAAADIGVPLIRIADGRTPRQVYLPTVAYVPEFVGAISDGAHHGGGLNGQDAYTGRVCAPTGKVRRLTPTECARLQGFPDDWNAWLADSHRYRQFGNAVCVPVAQWIANRIMEAPND